MDAVKKLAKPRDGSRSKTPALRARQGSRGPRAYGAVEKARARQAGLPLHDDSDDNWVSLPTASDSDGDSDTEVELSGDPKREELLKSLLNSYRTKVRQAARNWLKTQIEWKVQRKRHTQEKTKPPPQPPRVSQPPAIKSIRSKNPVVEENSPNLRTRYRWRVCDRKALRRLVLAFGPQRVELICKKVSTIKDRNPTGLLSSNSLCKVVKGDVLDCIWSFLVSVKNEVKSSRESAFMSELLDKMKQEATTKGWLVRGSFPSIVSTGEPTWDKIDTCGVSWARRLKLLDSIRQAFEYVQSPEKLDRVKRILDRIPETHKPAQWWNSDTDIELIKTSYNDGYGVYENFFSKGIFLNGISSDKNKGAPNEKPNADSLTRRLKRVVEILGKEARTIEGARDLPREVPPKPRADSSWERKSSRGSSCVFTKKEKTELIKYISIHGFPRKSTGETDWIKLCCSSNFSQKDPQGMESTCINIMEEAEKVLMDVSDSRDENGNRRKVSNLLSYPTANRLRERVELIDTLHAAFKILKGDWSNFSLTRGIHQDLPPWWKIGMHDKALCRGVLKHGYGSWAKISEDTSLTFHTRIEPNSNSADDKNGKTCVIPEKSAIKRLKYLNSALKKLMRQTKRKREPIEPPSAEGREDSHGPKSKRQKILNVEKDTNGRPILPLKITDRLHLKALGRVETKRKAFHSERHVFPIGFKTLREQQSFLPDKERIWYCCEIVDSGKNHPLFRVYPVEREDISVERDTPSGAWAEIFSRIQHLKAYREAGNDIKDYDPASYSGRRSSEEVPISADGTNKSKSTPKNAVSGTENFGLANPTIAYLISQLPDVDDITAPKGLYNPNAQDLKAKGRGKRKSIPDEAFSASSSKVKSVGTQKTHPTLIKENSTTSHKPRLPLSSVKYTEKEAIVIKRAESGTPDDTSVRPQLPSSSHTGKTIPPRDEILGASRAKADVTANKQIKILDASLVSPEGVTKMNGIEEGDFESNESVPLKESKFRIHTEIEGRNSMEPPSHDVIVTALTNGTARENGNGLAS